MIHYNLFIEQREKSSPEMIGEPQGTGCDFTFDRKLAVLPQGGENCTKLHHILRYPRNELDCAVAILS